MSPVTLELIARRNNKPTKWEMKGENIKPCPFCGGSEICLVQDEELHWCSCTDCGVEGPYRDTRLNAIGVWQERK